MKLPVLGASLCLFFLSVSQSHAETPSYTNDVRPFLTKYCFQCHKGNKGKAGVNLESYETMMKAGKKTQKYVVPEQPDKSQLVMSVEGKSGHKMPPRKNATQPTAMEIEVLRAWVKDGAKNDTPKQAELKIVPVRQSWEGVVKDKNLLKLAPQDRVVGEAKTWTILWKGWRENEKLPEIDFSKELVLSFTVVGTNKMDQPELRLNEKGDLKIPLPVNTVPPDDGSFSYKIVVIDRTGIQSINEKAIK